MLTSRASPPARYAADAIVGIRHWAERCGATLAIVDIDERRAIHAAEAADLCFGPYGSGPTRAVVERIRGHPIVLWNQGGADVPHGGAMVVDCLAPAGRYWAGLADVLRGDGVSPRQVAVLHARSGFGLAVGSGAVAALAPHGGPLRVDRVSAATARRVALAAVAEGAAGIVTGCRPEEDIAIAHALAGWHGWVGLVWCGVEAAGRALGDDIRGWVGPAQWLRSERDDIPDGWDYPAVQAFAAGAIATEALRVASSSRAGDLWSAARALRTTSVLGPFAVDPHGAQIAHAPLLVRWSGEPLRRVPVWRPGRHDSHAPHATLSG